MRLHQSTFSCGYPIAVLAIGEARSVFEVEERMQQDEDGSVVHSPLSRPCGLWDGDSLAMKSNLPDMSGPTVAFSPDNLLGQTLGGKYRIIREFSQGGMGKIYQAEQIALTRPVAITVIVSGTIRWRSPHGPHLRNEASPRFHGNTESPLGCFLWGTARSGCPRHRCPRRFLQRVPNMRSGGLWRVARDERSASLD